MEKNKKNIIYLFIIGFVTLFLIGIFFAPYTLAILFILALPSPFYLIIIHKRQRSTKLERIANSLGFSYIQKIDLNNFSEDFILLNPRDSTVYNFIQGRRAGFNVKIFDLNYSGTNIIMGEPGLDVFSQTVIMVTLKEKLPEFYLTERSITNYFLSTKGLQDVELEDYPDFSKRYLLRIKSKVSFKALFNQDIIKFFLRNRSRKIIWWQLCVEARERSFLYYRLGKRIKPSKLISFLDKSLILANLFNNDLINY